MASREEQAVLLAKRLKEVVREPEIQKDLEKLRQSGGIAYQLGLGQLIGRASKRAAVEVGVGDEKWDFAKTKELFKSCSSDAMVCTLTVELEELLLLPPGKVFGLQRPSSPPAPAPVAGGSSPSAAPGDSARREASSVGQDVLRVLQTLCRSCRQQDFQQNLEKLRASGGITYQLGLAQLLAKSIKAAAGECSLEGTWDVNRLKELVKQHCDDDGVHAAAVEVEQLLQVERGKVFGLKDTSAATPATKADSTPAPQRSPAESPSTEPRSSAAQPNGAVADRATAMLRSMSEVCRRADFQESIAKLQKSGGITLQLGRAQLMARAAKEAASEIGLDESCDLAQLKALVKEKGNDSALAAACNELEQLVGQSPGTIFGLKGSGPPPSSSAAEAQAAPPAAPAAATTNGAEQKDVAPPQSQGEKVKASLSSLRETCADETFQKDLERLRGAGGITYQLGLSQLLNRASKEVAKKLSLGDAFDLAKLKDSAKACADDAAVCAAACEVEEALQLKPGAIFKLADSAAKPKEEPSSAPPPSAPAKPSPQTPEAPEERALRLLQALKSACNQADCQDKLSKLRQSGGITLKLGMAQLLTKACKVASEEIGLGDGWDMAKVKEIVTECSHSGAVREVSLEVEQALGVGEGTVFGLKREPVAAEAPPRQPAGNETAKPPGASPMASPTLEQKEPRASPKPDANALLQALRDEVKKQESQAMLDKLHASPGVTLQLGLAQLVGKSCKAAAAALGLGDAWDTQKVKDLVKDAADDPAVRSLALELEGQLRVKPGSIFALGGVVAPAKPAPGTPTSPAEKAKALLEVLKEACHRDTFTKDLEKLQKSGGITLQLGLAQLFGRACKAAGAESGLDGDWDAQKVKDLVKGASGDPYVCSLAREVEGLLPVKTGSIFALPAPTDAPKPAAAAAASPEERATRLLEALRVACSKEEFRKDTEKLQKSGGITLQLGLAQLFARSCKAAAVDAGIGEDWDAQKVKDLVKETSHDPAVRDLALEVEGLLPVKSGSIFGLAPPAAPSEQQKPKLALDALKAACSREEFQKDLEKLQKSGGITFQLGLAQLLSRACKAAAAEAGFGGDWDMQKFKELVKAAGDDDGVRSRAQEIERLLHLGAGKVFGFSSETATPTATQQAPTDKATGLAQALERACSQPSFQEDLGKLRKSGGITFQLGLAQLMGRACKAAAAEVGLGEEWSTQMVKDLLKENSGTPAVSAAARAVEKLLQVESGSIFGMPEKKPDAAAPTAAKEQSSNERARSLLDALNRTLRADACQNDLEKLHSSSGITFQLGLAQLVAKACKAAAAEAGVGAEWDMAKTKEIVKAHVDDPAIQQQARDVESALRLQVGALFTAPTTDSGQGAAKLTPGDQARQLVEELKRQCEQADFQRDLEKLHSSGGITFQLGFGQLIGKAARSAAVKLGLGTWDMQKTKEFLQQHSQDVVVRRTTRDVEQAVGLGEGSLFNMPKSGDEGAPPATPVAATPPAAQPTAPKTPPMIIERDEQGRPILSIEQALCLQDELHEGFADEEFQDQLKSLETQHKRGTPAFLRARQELFLMVQKVVLPRYGFEGSARGVFDMMGAFNSFGWNEEFQKKGAMLNDLLGLGDQAAQIPAAQQAAPIRQQEPVVSEVEVIVRHAVEDSDEATVTVPSDATMGDVKAALGTLLGRPEIVKSGRLVRKVGGSGFSSFKDTEKLGSRRTVLLMGIEVIGAPPKEQPASNAEEPKAKAAAAKPKSAASKAKPQPDKDQPPDISLEEALALQRDLMRGFSDAGFQKSLRELRKTLQPTNERKFNMERQKLFLSVQKEVLPNYGFRGDQSGVFQMMDRFSKFAANPEFNYLGAVLNDLLFGTEVLERRKAADGVYYTKAEFEAWPGGVDAWNAAPAGELISQGELPVAEPEEVAPAAPEPDVEITVKHTTTEQEVQVTVPSKATVGDVKDALARKLSSTKIAESGRLVRKTGTTFTGFKDTEQIGARRKFFIMGVDDLKVERGPLSRDEAIGMQKELHNGFAEAQFQRKLKEMATKHGKSSGEFLRARAELVLGVQHQVLPKYGFEANAKGVRQMMKLLDTHSQEDVAFADLGSKINMLLMVEFSPPPVSGEASTPAGEEFEFLIPEGPFAGAWVKCIVTGPGAEKGQHNLHLPAQPPIIGEPMDVPNIPEALLRRPEVEEVLVDVTVKHAIQEGPGVLLRVPKEATLKAVKEALATKLNRPEVAKQGRLVKKLGDSFTSMKEVEKIGSRRAFLMMNVENLVEPAAPEEAAAAAEAVVERNNVEDREEPLSLQQAISLQQELLSAFSAESFQHEMQEAAKKHGRGSRQFATQRQQLALEQQKLVLPKYGFEGTSRGVFHMVEALAAFAYDQEFQQLADKLNDLLWLNEVVEEPKKVEPKEQVEVEITVKHAVIDGEEVQVKVPSTATMKQVKEAVAQALGRPEIMKSGRLVRKAGSTGAFTSFSDGDSLGTRTALLMMGVENLRPAEGAVTPKESKPAVVEASGPPAQLTLEEALSLQRDLIEGFSAEGFQTKLTELRKTLLKTNIKKFNFERTKLYLTVQHVVLPRHGFSGDMKGVFDMLDRLNAHNGNAEFDGLGSYLNGLLGLDALGQPAPLPEEPEAAGQEAEVPEEVQVTVKHAINEDVDDTVVVTLLPTATMREVKEALALQLGRGDIAKSARIVRRAGAALTSYSDSETLGVRRSLLVVGVDDLKSSIVPREQQVTNASEVKEPGEPPTLTLEEALSLQRELAEGFAAEDFQQKLKELGEKHPGRGLQFNLERAKLFLTVQGKVLPKFGFAGTAKGVFQMTDRLQVFAWNEEFIHMTGYLNYLLGLFESADQRKPEEETGHAAAAEEAEEEMEVSVTIRHAVKDDSVELQMSSSSATMRQVKEALAAHLGRPEIVKEGRFVRRIGGSFSTFLDEEKLGARRSLLLLGVSDLKQKEAVTSKGGDAAGRDVAASMTMEEALKLQRDLVQGFSTQDFQSKLQQLLKAQKSTDRNIYNQQRSDLFLTVQSTVLPNYGLSGDRKGVLQMMSLLSRFGGQHPEFDANGQQLNKLLGLDSNGRPIEIESESIAGEEVSIIVKHAINETQQVELTVLSTATMREVKEQLANTLRRPDVAKNGKMVRRQAGALTSFTDSDVLGTRRSLLIIGVDHLQPGAAVAAEAAPQQKGAPQQKSTPAGPPVINLETALNIQRDLLRGFSAEAFQLKLRELQAKHPVGGKQFNMDRQKLFLTVQSVVLPRHGFEGSTKGVFQMMDAFNAFQDNPEFQQLGFHLTNLLGLNQPPAGNQPAPANQAPPAAAPAAPQQPGEEVEVIGRHALHEEQEVKVRVQSTATLLAFKQTLASTLGRPEITKQLRCVRRVGAGGFTSLKDSEEVGSRRTILLMGVDKLGT